MEGETIDTMRPKRWRARSVLRYVYLYVRKRRMCRGMISFASEHKNSIMRDNAQVVVVVVVDVFGSCGEQINSKVKRGTHIAALRLTQSEPVVRDTNPSLSSCLFRDGWKSLLVDIIYKFLHMNKSLLPPLP